MSTTPPQHDPRDTPSTPLPPPRVPDHELLRRIGRGAYGEVWLGRSATGAFRAVKIVHRQSFDHDRPFDREFEGILKFEPISRQHDSQVDILHVGRGDDCFYYVMELADDQATGGQINPDNYAPRTLKSDLLFHGRLTFEECVRIGLALATALENLHGNGLVHRDVKPSNIIFVNGVPKLADIGLVAGVEATRSYVGTEGFAAPEGPGTPQADLYSLGKVLYEAATGKDRQEFPELPTQLRELPDRDGLMELNAVIARACRHDPKDRYASAAAMRTDLELLQSGKSLARLHRTEKRLRFVQRAGVIVTAIAALIAGGWLWQARQTDVVRDLADEKTKLVEENRERLVRLKIANGVRLLDEGDPAGALLWFAEALPLVTNKPAEETIHRIRIQQVLEQTPRLLLAVNPRGAGLSRTDWSPDGTRFAGLVTYKDSAKPLEVGSFDARDGQTRWCVKLRTNVWNFQGDLRFSQDGKQLFCEPCAAILNADTGREFFPDFASNAILSVFSPDERWLALAQPNHTVRVAPTFEERAFIELRGHTNRVTMLSFSANGNLLASAGRDRTARLWLLPSGEPAGPPLVHDLPVLRAQLSDDGRRLVTTTERDTNGLCWVQVWDAQTHRKVGAPITVPVQSMYEEPGAFFSPISGEHLFTAGRWSDVRSWDVEPQKLRATLRAGNTVRCWDFSPDATQLAVGSWDGTVSVWSVATGELLRPRFRYSDIPTSVRFSRDGTRLLVAAGLGMVMVWSLESPTNSATLVLPADLPKGQPQDYSPQQTAAVPIPLDLQDGALHLIDPEQLLEVHRLEFGSKSWAWEVGHTGRFWATEKGSIGGQQNLSNKTDQAFALSLWQKSDTRFTRRELPHPKPLMQFAFNGDDSRLVTFCEDWAVRFWRTSDGELERTVRVPRNLTPPLRGDVDWFRPDCGALVVMHGEKNRTLQLFDLRNENLIGQPFTNFLEGESVIRFSPSGHRLAIAMMSARGYILDLETTNPPVSFVHGGYIRDLAWSADGRRVLSAGMTDKALLWDAATGKQLLSPLVTDTSGSDAWIARWSADSRFIVTRSDKNSARVWDANTAEPVTPYLPHSGYIRFACVTQGNRLITGSDPNLLRAWDLKPTRLRLDVIADYAKLVSGRELNASGVPMSVFATMPELYQSLRARAPELFDQE